MTGHTPPAPGSPAGGPPAASAGQLPFDALHQFVPTFEPGAVGAHCLLLRDLCRSLGIASEIYAEHRRGPRSAEAHYFRDYSPALRGDLSPAHGGDLSPAHGGDLSPVLVYQMAIGSTVADFVTGLPGRLVVNYHNLTPPSFYTSWQPEVVPGITWGFSQLRSLAARACGGVADSAFNEADLIRAGYARTAVAPVLVDLAAVSAPVAAVGASASAAGGAGRVPDVGPDGANWLFVGRLAANKCQHDVIKAFAVYRRAFDPAARLHLVGGGGSSAYASALARFVPAAGLAGAVSIVEHASPAELRALYRSADVFVCLSEHEGFCVPLLEAWANEVPVVAFASSAVIETAAEAAVMLPSKEPSRVAAAVARVLNDNLTRRRVVVAGTSRLEQFRLERTGPRLLSAIADLARGPAGRR
ncbi:MAG: glycosyltransferase [Acidimicrobiales bacterium]